jgi:tRNA dimethylallyltransferase
MRTPPYDQFPPPPDQLAQGDPAGAPLVVIVGPTGVGKSDLALRLAEANRGAIVSADSRQIYRDFTIGTAKPTASELARVPHDMIDHVDPTYTYTVAEYQADATAAIARRREQGYLPFVVGGTGLYVRAVLDGLTIPPVAPDPAFRERLAAVDDLHARLAEVDPASAERLHPNDRVRLVRALEVFHHTGQPIGAFQATAACPYRLLYLGVGSPRTYLYDRIDARVLTMIASGFVDEVKDLADRYGWELPLMRTLGYAEVGAYLRGELSQAEAIALMAQHTRNYAKRQLTWFRADTRIRWLMRGPDTDLDALVDEAQGLLRSWAMSRGAT